MFFDPWLIDYGCRTLRHQGLTAQFIWGKHELSIFIVEIPISQKFYLSPSKPKVSPEPSHTYSKGLGFHL